VNANNGGGNATIYTVGGTYSLSKRTQLDIQIATARDSKNANFGLNSDSYGDTKATDDPYLVTASPEHMSATSIVSKREISISNSRLFQTGRDRRSAVRLLVQAVI
jgi:hypothetical protein